MILTASVFMIGVVVGGLAVHAFPDWDMQVGGLYDRITGYKRW